MIDVARPDVPLGGVYGLHEPVPAHAGNGIGESAPPTGRYTPLESAYHVLANGLPLRLVAGMQEGGAARQVIEHEDARGRDPCGLRDRIAVFAPRRQTLEVTDDVVGGRADHAALERGCLGLGRQFRCPGERRAHRVEQFVRRARSRE